MRQRHPHAASAALVDLAPYDEVGTPDDQLERCEDCRALYRVDGWHRCTD